MWKQSWEQDPESNKPPLHSFIITAEEDTFQSDIEEETGFAPSLIPLFSIFNGIKALLVSDNNLSSLESTTSDVSMWLRI